MTEGERVGYAALTELQPAEEAEVAEWHHPSARDASAFQKRPRQWDRLGFGLALEAEEGLHRKKLVVQMMKAARIDLETWLF